MNTTNLVASSLISVFLILHYVTPFSSCANSFSGSINWRPSGKRSSPNFLDGQPAFDENLISAQQTDALNDDYTRAQIIQALNQRAQDIIQSQRQLTSQNYMYPEASRNFVDNGLRKRLSQKGLLVDRPDRELEMDQWK